MAGFMQRLRKRSKLQRELIDLSRGRPVYGGVEDLKYSLKGKYKTGEIEDALNVLIEEGVVVKTDVSQGRSRLMYVPVM